MPQLALHDTIVHRNEVGNGEGVRFRRSEGIRFVKIVSRGGMLMAIGRIGELHVVKMRARLGFAICYAPFLLQR